MAFLRVDLAETKDGTDYNLLTWVEKRGRRHPIPSQRRQLEASRYLADDGPHESGI
jgi:hypothetical protein